MAQKKATDRLRGFNMLLFILIIIMVTYLALFPLTPGLILWIQDTADPTRGYVYHSNLTRQIGTGIEKRDLKDSPENNQLVIPKISIDTEILEGETTATLDEGVWHYPNSSTPDKGGNTILVGHRRMYTLLPDIFYNLPVLEEGDKFIIFWEGQEYDYEILEVKTVEPSEVDLKEQSGDANLTLYTSSLDTRKQIIIKAKKS